MTCSATEAEELLTVNEAAERFKLSPKTLYKWIRCEAVEVVRVGPKGAEVRIVASSLVSSRHPASI